MVLGDRDDIGPGERIGIAAMKGLSFVLVGGLRKFRPIHAVHVARAMIAVASHGREGIFHYESDVIQAFADTVFFP